MARDPKKPSHYEVLDVSMSAKPEMIRTAYIRAKNTYARDSLAAYTMFDPEESQRILEQIEEAYNVLSDPERRRKYDEAHGFMNHETESSRYAEPPPTFSSLATSFSTAEDDSAFPRGRNENEDDMQRAADFGDQEAVKPERTLSAIERVQATQAASAGASSNSFGPARPYKLQRAYEQNPEMEERIRRAENVTGAFLKEVRLYKKATLEEMMELTKISRAYLEALEEDNLQKLPAAVYVRGFVAQYSKALGLDTDRIASSYMSYFKTKRP